MGGADRSALVPTDSSLDPLQPECLVELFVEVAHSEGPLVDLACAVPQSLAEKVIVDELSQGPSDLLGPVLVQNQPRSAVMKILRNAVVRLKQAVCRATEHLSQRRTRHHRGRKRE